MIFGISFAIISKAIDTKNNTIGYIG